MLTILLGVFFIAVTFHHYFIRPLHHWRKKGISQGNPMWFFGENFLNFIGSENLTITLDKAYKKNPGSRYHGIYLFTSPALMIKDPTLLKQLTIKYFEHFPDRRNFLPRGVDTVWDRGLIQLQGKKWKHMRPVLSSSFTSGKMKLLFESILDCSENFIKYFIEKEEDNIELDIKDVMSRYSNDVTVLTILGITVDSTRNPNNEFYLNLKDATDLNSNRAILFFNSTFILTRCLIKLFGIQFYSTKVTNFFRNIVNEALQIRSDNRIVRPDLINIFLETEKNLRNDRAIDKEDLVSQGLLYLIGGLDTTSSTLMFLCYELALNKSIQDKLRHEIMDTKNNTKGRLTYDSLLNMKYMDMVISECTRKYPLISATQRVCSESFVIEPSGMDEKPLVIEKGTLLWLPIFSLHHDPELFEDPELFNPERFNDANKHKIDQYTFIPFGIGPRSCIGSRYSLLSMKVVIFHLLSSFELSPTNKTQIPLQYRKKSFFVAPEKKIFLELRRLKN